MIAHAVEMVLVAGLGSMTAFVGSMPVAGPLAVLVVQRSVSGQRLSAVLAAAGGGLVEGGYALAIGLALPLLMKRIQVLVPISQGLGAVAITLLALALIVRPQFFDARSKQGKRRSLMEGVAVTALNPTLLATWTLVITTLYSHGWLELAPHSAIPFAIGVFLGTTSWFGLVAFVGHRFERRMDAKRRWVLMRALGGALLVASVYLACRTVLSLQAS